MHAKAVESLDIAHTYVEQIAEQSTNPEYKTVEAINGLSQVVYHVGMAIVRQIAEGTDK